MSGSERPGSERPGGELHADERGHFMATMGFELRVEGGTGTGAATMTPYLQAAPGWPGAAALATFADVLIGLIASQLTHPRISVTSGLETRVVRPVPAGCRLALRARLVRSGRSLTVGEAEARTADSGDLVAMAIGTFLASPRPQDVAPDHFPAERSPAPGAQTPAAPTLVEHVGIHQPAPGHARISLRPDLHNATQSLQGGLVALLAEVAASGAASAAAGVAQVVEGLDVHYLAAARVGPFHARAEMVGDHLARVLTVDNGSAGRAVSLVMARTRPAPD